MAVQLHRVLAGQPLDVRGDDPPHVDRLARSLTIRYPAPQAFTLDGDLFRAADITIRCGPRVRIVRP
jgi:hypothetical protein